MTHPSLALQAAVVSALLADTDLAALVGDRIYDRAPRAAGFPFVTIGQASVADWSTGTEAGAEHRLLLHVWSRERGKKQTYRIMEALEAALDGAALSLDGHALVNLAHEFAETRPDPDGVTIHGVVRFRAVTEPA